MTFVRHLIDSDSDYFDVGCRRRFLSSPTSSDCEGEKDTPAYTYLLRIFAKKMRIYSPVLDDCSKQLHCRLVVSFILSWKNQVIGHQWQFESLPRWCVFYWQSSVAVVCTLSRTVDIKFRSHAVLVCIAVIFYFRPHRPLLRT